MASGLPLNRWDENSFGRTLADNAPIGLALVDEEACIIYVNPSLSVSCGREPRELEGHPFAEIFDPESAEMVMAAASDDPSLPPGQPFLCRLSRPDGVCREVEVREMRVAYEGRLIHFFAVSDVTEREALLHSLADSDNRFRIATTLTSDYIYEYNLQTGIISWSMDIGELLGYEPDEMPHTLESMGELIHPEDRELVQAAIARHAADRTNFCEEYRARRKDGAYVTVVNHSTAVVEPDDSVRRWIGAVSDVTEARRMEKELRTSEEKFRIAAQLVTDCIYEWNRDRNFLGLEWSNNIDSMLGYEPGEFPRDMLGSNEHIHPDDRERVLASVKRHAEDGEPFDTEYRLRRKDGQYITVSSRARVIKDGRGVPARWIGVNTDVTEKNRVEEELRESEARFWSFVNESVYGYAELDLEANLIFVNERAEEIVGYGLPSEKRLNLRDLIHPDDLGLALHNFGQVIHPPTKTPREYRVRHKDGRYVYVEINSLPLRRKGKITGFQCTVLDVSERRHATEELQRRERILEAVARDAKKFLQSNSWRDNIREVLADVGQAAGVRRAYVFEIMGPPGEKFVGSLYDWIRGQTFPPEIVANLNASNWREDPFLQRAIESLRQGQAFTGRYRDFSPDLLKVFPNSADMTFQGVPILVSGELWGAFGFDYETADKLGSVAEIDILKIMANTLGAAIQRERAEEVVRESGQRYRLVVENLIDVIWTSDLDFNMTYFSPSVEALTGYTVEEALQNKVTDVLVPESLEEHQRKIQEVKAGMSASADDEGGEPPKGPVEARLRRKDGRAIWVEVSLSITRDANNQPTGFQGTMRDISHRKAMEQALTLSQEKLRAQYNAIPVPTYTWQREGEDFILVDFNEAAVRITNGMISKYLHVKASVLYGDNPGIIRDLHRCFEEKSVFEREMEYNYMSTGQRKFLVVKYAFVAPDQVIAHTEDVTEKKMAMERLAEAERQAKQTLSAEVRLRRSKDYQQTESDDDLQSYPSPSIHQTLADARIAAQSDGVVMLLGASGVGKTYLAGWIHQRSGRADGPFFDINCAALTPSLIESELFGHEAGAFTGSKGRRRGLLELAHNGTLFLDEIGDMPQDLQAKLLNFLDTHRFMRLGGEAKVQVNTRIMVATNRDLPALVQSGAFRQDLYYRLNVFTIVVPALTERREDIPMLAANILRRLSLEMGLPHPPVLAPEAIRALNAYSWPGNVRELRNTLERVLLRAENKEVISEVPLQSTINTGPRRAIIEPENGDDLLRPGENFDQAVEGYMLRLIKKALDEAKTKTDAAQLLGISRHALNRYCRKYGLL